MLKDFFGIDPVLQHTKSDILYKPHIAAIHAALPNAHLTRSTVAVYACQIYINIGHPIQNIDNQHKGLSIEQKLQTLEIEISINPKQRTHNRMCFEGDREVYRIHQNELVTDTSQLLHYTIPGSYFLTNYMFHDVLYVSTNGKVRLEDYKLKVNIWAYPTPIYRTTVQGRVCSWYHLKLTSNLKV